MLANLAKDFSRQASLLTPPTVPLNAFGGTGQSNDVYLSLFQPAATEQWPGNLKKYRFDTINGRTLLVDANGSALLTEQNLIKSSAVSLWSAPLMDGANVALGGAASRLTDPDNRNLLTNAGSGGTILAPLDTGNTNITAMMLGAPESERNNVIEWARGVDVRDANEDGDNTEPRLSMGDPLHVQPVIATYSNGNTVIFVSTNDGYLHAVDAITGDELWSFVPERLLSRLYALSINETALNKRYGLDGQPVLVFNDEAQPDTLIFGMRRGGEALFALDISQQNSPSLKWIIDSTQQDFLDLGQTWSTPVIARMTFGGQSRQVAIFGGGYDPGQDNRAPRQDTKGNALFIVDVATGERLWSAGSTSARSSHALSLPRMNYSIPAGIRVLDVNENGEADRFYVGDMGGQIWRFDIVDGAGQGGVLASLGIADLTSPTVADTRRFYNTPDVANVIKDQNIFFSISLGSGYRAHPLDTSIDDEFYSIRDYQSGVVILTETYDSPDLPVITRDDLIDITDDAEFALEPDDAGWRLGMVQSDGEKVLGESLTINEVVFFNSFSPGGDGQSCIPGAGQNRSYRISILDGNALTNLDGSIDTENLTPADRYVDASFGVPLTGPVLFGEDPVICSGLECFSEDAGDGADGDSDGDSDDDPDDDGGIGPEKVNRTYWFPRETP